MGKIDDLIKELCPDGVEWKTIEETCDILDSQRKPISKSKRKSGTFPYYGANGIQDWVDGYIFDGTYILMGEDGSVINKDNTPVLNWVSGKIWVNNHAHILKEGNNQVDLRFIYYILQTVDVSGIVRGVPPKINQANLKGITIPLPPLSIQQQIVEILDTFTDSISNLQEELELREKQMEYYRENLLSFDGEDVEYVSFGQSFHLKARIGWQGLTKQEYRNQGLYKLVTGTDFTDNHRINFSKCVYVDKERFDQDKNIQLKEDDILITKDGTLGKVAYIDKLPCPTTLNGGVFVVRNITGELNQRFTMHFLASSKFKRWIDSNHTSGSIKHLTQKLFVKFQIPVPSLSRQQEIVDILDTFESMIANIKEEIELRQKQYEYYREKLLTFD